jgi:hypothetical protein
MASDDHFVDLSEDLSEDLRDDLRLMTSLMTNLIRCCTRSRSLPTKRGTPREALRLATSEVGKWDTLPRTCCSECRQWPIGENGCAFAACFAAYLLGYRLESERTSGVGVQMSGDRVLLIERSFVLLTDCSSRRLPCKTERRRRQDQKAHIKT